MGLDAFYRTLSVEEREDRNKSLNSPLLRLPAELRNQIYMMTLENIILGVRPAHTYLDPPKALALLSTCRQTRSEASAFLYTHCTFDISTVFAPGGAPWLFLSSIPGKAVQSVKMNGNLTKEIVNAVPKASAGSLWGRLDWGCSHFQSLVRIRVAWPDQAPAGAGIWCDREEVEYLICTAFGKWDLVVDFDE